MTSFTSTHHPPRGWVVAIVAAALVGCGDSGVPRLDLHGKVTYEGKPVPAGELRFEPNVSKGGSGPIGFASIVDGEYDTRDEDKGPVSGPVRVTITGYKSAEAFAPTLFRKHRVELDLDGSQRQYDFDVPVQGQGG